MSARFFMRRALLVLLAAFALLPPALAQDARETTVQTAAREWLALIDRGDHAASWKAAGAKFKADITEERWSDASKAVTEQFGRAVQRSVRKTNFTRSFPGVLDGDYALVIFRTAFAHKTEGEETVTLEHEPDGKWRVIGYFIR
jgi:hypothetical protein